jgi:hypothetical protein
VPAGVVAPVSVHEDTVSGQLIIERAIKVQWEWALVGNRNKLVDEEAKDSRLFFYWEPWIGKSCLQAQSFEHEFTLPEMELHERTVET